MPSLSIRSVVSTGLVVAAGYLVRGTAATIDTNAIVDTNATAYTNVTVGHLAMSPSDGSDDVMPFKDSCLRWGIYEYPEDGMIQLWGHCLVNSALAHCTILDINKCFRNQGGAIVPGSDGGFYGSCWDCNLNTAVHPLVELTCTCKTGEGDFTVGSTFQLTPTILNAHGVLECFNEQGVDCN